MGESRIVTAGDIAVQTREGEEPAFLAEASVEVAASEAWRWTPGSGVHSGPRDCVCGY